MTAAEATIVEDRGGGELLRRLILGALALYLSPVILLVLAIGGVGMVCCSVLRWLGRPRAGRGAGRRDRGTPAVAAPHLGVASRIRPLHR